jgi:hypothetical protein
MGTRVGEGPGGPGGSGQLIGSMGLVWRGACNCAQRATTPIKGLFSLIEHCLSSIMYVYVLYAFFFSKGKKKNYVSEKEHAFILGWSARSQTPSPYPFFLQSDLTKISL